MKQLLECVNEGFDRMSLGQFVCFCAGACGLMFIIGVAVMVGVSVVIPGFR
jgi:hypothetical protein